MYRLIRPPWILAIFALLAACSILLASGISFDFDYRQFLPKGDKDLAFFQEYQEQFEADDNVLLVGIRDSTGIFKTSLLKDVDSLTRQIRALPYVKTVQSLTTFQYTLISPFGIVPVPAVHLSAADQLSSDSARIMKDERIRGLLVSHNGQSLSIMVKTFDTINPGQSGILIDSLSNLLKGYHFPETHLLGKANFQQALIELQKRQFFWAILISGLLVTLVFYLFFRRVIGVLIALLTVAVSMLLLLGLIGAFFSPLDMMSALFPILMIIVGVSDVVHLMTKYTYELRHGLDRATALQTTFRQIGLALFLTSFTTAVGFLSLLTSNILPVRKFGLTAAIGVMLAYLTVIFLTTSLLALSKPTSVSRKNEEGIFWQKFLGRFYHFVSKSPLGILAGTFLFVIICGFGLVQIKTDTRINDSLPRGHAVTDDFFFFEREFNGFKPFEMAAIAQDSFEITDLAVLTEIDKTEAFIKRLDIIHGVFSITSFYKSINQAEQTNDPEAYKLAASEATIQRQSRYLPYLQQSNINVLLSEDRKLGRITGSIKDISRDSIMVAMSAIRHFVKSQTDSSIVKFRITGTMIMLEKNGKQLKKSVFQGLGIAFLVISLLMAVLFQNWRLVIISLIPNIIPLLFGAALTGYLGISLDAGTGIIFAICFGIVVDDTIHFLSRFRIELMNGRSREDAIRITFLQTGKAIFITTIILFFGFLILLFSPIPVNQRIGLLISCTLFTAVFADMLLLPVLLKYGLGKERS